MITSQKTGTGNFQAHFLYICMLVTDGGSK